jgi:hypothetical protein
MGYTGSFGTAGYVGSLGPSGPAGTRGYTGSIGPSGASGLAGSPGRYVNTVPSSSIGRAGDQTGDVIVDKVNGYFYVCTANYNGSSDIWVRISNIETAF